MTTIAYRAGVMAADSCLTIGKENPDNSLYIGNVEKMYRLSDGSVLGLSGDAEGADIITVLANPSLVTNTQIVEALSNVIAEATGILVRPDGRMFWVGTSVSSADDEPAYAEFYEFHDEFAACGTGSWIAYGAMEAGASAQEAVLAACRRHPYTREPVKVLQLNPD